jgi:hypothetical protein
VSKNAVRAAGALVAWILGGTAALAGPLPGFTLTAQTDRFIFYTRDAQKVNVEKTEKYLARLEGLLGHKVAGKATYYRYGTPEEVAAGTGMYAAGVTLPRTGEIHSTRDFHAHEIVHLVAGQIGDPGTFFQEGLAVALGNEGRWEGKDVDSLARARAKGWTLASLIADFDRLEPGIGYPLAGSFVARLIKAHGVAKVAEFFRACGPAGSDREGAFARTFGRSLEQAGIEWLTALG